MAIQNKYAQQYLADALLGQNGGQEQFVPDYGSQSYIPPPMPGPDFSQAQSQLAGAVSGGDPTLSPVAGGLSAVTSIIDGILKGKAAQKQQQYDINRQQQLAEIVASQDPMKMASSGDPEISKLGMILIQQQIKQQEAEADRQYKYDALENATRGQDLQHEDRQAKIAAQDIARQQAEARRLQEEIAAQKQKRLEHFAGQMRAEEAKMLYDHPELEDALIAGKTGTIFGIGKDKYKTRLDKKNPLVKQLMENAGKAGNGIKITQVG